MKNKKIQDEPVIYGIDGINDYLQEYALLTIKMRNLEIAGISEIPSYFQMQDRAEELYKEIKRLITDL